MSKNNIVTNGNGTFAPDAKIIAEATEEKSTRETKTDVLDDDLHYDRLTPTVVHLRSTAYEDGLDVAEKSNDFRPNPETEEKLKDKWQKVAKEADQGLFDTETNLHDKHYQDEFDRLQEIRQDAEDALHTAEINLREKEETLAPDHKTDSRK